MSQSVYLDMEVLQRIKFLMEYDVVKTSSENILLEQNVQSKLTYNQELAKRAGYGNVTSQKADELAVSGKLVYAAQQGLPLKTLMGTDPESKFKQSVANSGNQDKKRSGTIDVARTNVNRMYSQPAKEVREMRIDELTLKVRSIMSDWRTGTIETIAVMLGIGIPVVIGANGIWVTLEVAQLLKGTPSWLDLVFSIIAISTVGAGPAVLKPLYNRTAQILKGKGGKGGISEVVDAMYKAAVELGLLNKLKPILNAVSKASNTIIDVVGKTWTWLNDNVFWIFKGVTWLGKVSIDAMRSALTGIFKAFDNFVAYIGRKSGLDPAFSSKLGPAVRVGGVVGGTGYGISKYLNQPPPPTIKANDFEKLDTSDWFKD